MQELLLRFADQSPALRQQMLARTGQLVAVAAAASPDGALERKVRASVGRNGWGDGGQQADVSRQGHHRPCSWLPHTGVGAGSEGCADRSSIRELR